MQKQKVLFFGNTNNELFRLASAFGQDPRMDVTIVLTQQGTLHSPFSLGMKKVWEFKGRIVDLRYILEEEQVLHSKRFRKKIRNLGNFDAGILDNIGPSLYQEFDFPFLSYVTGSNLTYYGNPEFHRLRSSSWEHEFKVTSKAKSLISSYDHFSNLQREGFEKSIGLICFPQGSVPAEDKMLSHVSGPRIHYLLFSVDSSRNFVNRTTDSSIFVPVRWSQPQASDPFYSERDDKGFYAIQDFITRFLSIGPNSISVKITSKGSQVLLNRFLDAIPNELRNRVSLVPELRYRNYKHLVDESVAIVDSLGPSPIGRIALDGIASSRFVVSTTPLTFLEHFFFDVENLPVFSPEVFLERATELIRTRPIVKRDYLEAHNALHVGRIYKGLGF